MAVHAVSSKMTTSTTVLPSDWPQEAENEFERIRVLGKGAFGEVWLAKLKSSASSKEEEDYAAIKGVSITSEKEERTADREIAILQEMNHPNIIRLVRSYEPVPNASGRYLALSYVPGKDVGQILEVRGALALSLAQMIARHLISAIAYLHVRGVMHRDIKPDNIMLKGWADHYMWAEEETVQEAVESGKFSAILVDFGFARATRKADYVSTERDNIERRSINSSSSINRSGNKFHRSSMRYSRRVFRTMSAVGTANFAAPEILSTIREQRGSSCLTKCVSSYSLISDAYAVGATLNETLTGVPPGEEVESYVKANRKDDEKDEEPSSAKPAKKSFFSCCSTVAVVEPKPQGANTVCLRYMHELPKPANDLIVKLMQKNAEKRLSVRDAQEHEWIGGYDSLPHGDCPAHTNDPIVFVKNEAAFV